MRVTMACSLRSRRQCGLRLFTSVGRVGVDSDLSTRAVQIEDRLCGGGLRPRCDWRAAEAYCRCSIAASCVSPEPGAAAPVEGITAQAGGGGGLRRGYTIVVGGRRPAPRSQ